MYLYYILIQDISHDDWTEMRTPSRRTFALAVVAVAAVGLTFVTQPQSTPASNIATSTATGLYAETSERLGYQTMLNSSPERFEPGFDVIVSDGSAWLRADRDNSYVPCALRCGTVSGSKVSLPVGYRHANNVEPQPTSKRPIEELTYWNPILHKLETAKRSDGQATVVLPGFLYQSRSLSSLQVGETGYVPAAIVRRARLGTTYLLDGHIGYEPMDASYGYSPQAQVTKMGPRIYYVHLPAGTTPIVTDDIERDNRWVQVIAN